MLDENAVLKHVAKHLEGKGFAVLQILPTTQSGVDLIAEHKETKIRLLVEATGETSARIGSNRYGKPYTSTQVYDRVSKTFFATVRNQCTPGNKEHDLSAIALPATKLYRKYLEGIRPAVEKIGVHVFWVLENGNVKEGWIKEE